VGPEVLGEEGCRGNGKSGGGRNILKRGLLQELSLGVVLRSNINKLSPLVLFQPGLIGPLLNP
jgi:hypothetical protein